MIFQRRRPIARAGVCALLWAALSLIPACVQGYRHKYVAADLHDDGLGAQLMPRLTCILEATTNPNITYVHVPFKAIEHGMNASECESWFNVGENEIALSSLPSTIPSGDQVVHVMGCHKYADKRPHMWSQLKQTFRSKYFSPSATYKPAPQHNRKTAVNVAVHLRRGDVVGNCGLHGPQDANNQERSHCIPNHYVAGVIRQVAEKLGNMTSLPINVQVFTEGNNLNGELDELIAAAPEVGLNFDGNALHVFHAMMSSDVLIMAHSSFSLMAAIYGAADQLVVYDRFWHKPVPEWVHVKKGVVGGKGWRCHDSDLCVRAVRMAEARGMT